MTKIKSIKSRQAIRARVGLWGREKGREIEKAKELGKAIPARETKKPKLFFILFYFLI
jgi:hypothetical protein